MLAESHENVKHALDRHYQTLAGSLLGSYNLAMEQSERHRYMPDVDRLSILAAIILLAFAVARLINLPGRLLSMQLPGIYLAVEVNLQMLVSVLIAGLTAAGADWLIRDHPKFKKHSALQHWLLPALTALVMELPLFQLPFSPMWWVGFAFGGILLILVLVSEYIVVDPQDVRQPLAAAGLTAVSFALFLVLASALRFAVSRLFLALPALTAGAFLVSLRTLNLRLHDRWLLLPAGLTALVVAQIATAFHYWPLSPVSFGLALLGPAYALTTFFGNLAEGMPTRQAFLEPVIVLGLLWSIGIWLE